MKIGWQIKHNGIKECTLCHLATVCLETLKQPEAIKELWTAINCNKIPYKGWEPLMAQKCYHTGFQLY